MRVKTYWGSTVTTTEVACLVFRECLLGLRYLAERIRVALSLRIACLTYWNNSSSCWERICSGSPWIASSTAVGATTSLH